MVAKYLVILLGVPAVAAKSGAQPRQPQRLVVKQCPMPVQRPDASRLIQMPNIGLSPGAIHPMPRLELNCPNPLDPGRAIPRSPN